MKIREQIKRKTHIKLVDFAKMLPVSRSTLYVYMDNYDTGNFGEGTCNELYKDFFDYIVNSKGINYNEIARYINEHFVLQTETNAIVKEQTYKVEIKYIDKDGNKYNNVINVFGNYQKVCVSDNLIIEIYK